MHNTRKGVSVGRTGLKEKIENKSIAGNTQYEIKLNQSSLEKHLVKKSRSAIYILH